MTSANQPFPYYNGIAYNSAFFTTSGTGLTVSQANAKYLQKTITDTATALEVFNAGIKTDAITAIGSTSSIFTDPNLYQTNTLNIGQNNLNCNIGKASQTCNIGELGVGGVNVGYNMSPASYVSIGLGSATQDTIVAIGSKDQFPATANNILIGASGNTTTLASSNTIINTLKTNTIDPTTTGGTIQIGQTSNNVQILNGNYTSGQTSGAVNILSGTHAAGTIGGNCNFFTGSRGTLTIGATTNNSITVVKQTQFTNGTYCDKTDGIAASSAMTIGNTLLTGSVEVANGASFTGGVNIGTKGGTPASNTVSIGGGSGTTTTLYSGTTYLGYTGSTLNVATPMTPTYNPSAITSGKIGYSVTPTYNTPYTLSPSVVKNIATYSLPIGVYFIQASILTPTVVTYQGLGISSTSATLEYECWSNILTDGYVWLALCVSRMVVITTASTPYYIIAQAGDTRTLLQVRTQCFRIA
jgi:hypothetical protein